MSEARLPDKKTKIVCTIGPASESEEVLVRMIERGMNVARINFAHGDLDGHRRVIAAVRAASRATGSRVAIFGDLPGPKMRIGELGEEPVEIVRGDEFVLQTDEIVGDAHRVSMSFERLPEVVSPGDSIFVNDGFIELRVVSTAPREVRCEVVVGGELRSHKGVNFPGSDLGISAFTDADREFLAFAAEEKLDGVSMSFVEGAADVTAVKAAAASMNYDPFVIAKIERARACDNLEEILEVADGIMVARGDLGVEIPVEEIAAAQKRIVTRANRSAVPVITATHMLESMITNSRPTRAEVTDVANAILDGTDCVMLSGESAIGRFPVETVGVMAGIARVTEPERGRHTISDLLELDRRRGEIEEHDLISLNIFMTTEILHPTIIFVPSRTGSTARRIARFRPPVWIVSFSDDESACQKLQFSYGIYPDLYDPPVENWQAFVRDWMGRAGAAGERVLLAEGSGTLGTEDYTRIDIIGLDEID
jgi:pyruvate kinase